MVIHRRDKKLNKYSIIGKIPVINSNPGCIPGSFMLLNKLLMFMVSVSTLQEYRDYMN